MFHLSLTHCHLGLSPRNFFEGFLVFSGTLPTGEVGDRVCELCDSGLVMERGRWQSLIFLAVQWDQLSTHSSPPNEVMSLKGI